MVSLGRARCREREPRGPESESESLRSMMSRELICEKGGRVLRGLEVAAWWGEWKYMREFVLVL